MPKSLEAFCGCIPAARTRTGTLAGVPVTRHGCDVVEPSAFLDETLTCNATAKVDRTQFMKQ